MIPLKSFLSLYLVGLFFWTQAADDHNTQDSSTKLQLPKVYDKSALEKCINNLNAHIEGRTNILAYDLLKYKAIIEKNVKFFKDDFFLIKKAFFLVKKYELKYQPLFINAKTRGGYRKEETRGIELELVIFALQQGLIDYAYHSDNLNKHGSLFKDQSFLTAAYFPGAVDQPKDPDLVHKVQINASQLPNLDSPLTTDNSAARRPTGWYLAPGSIVDIAFPKSIVGKGYSIRVGAHSWDLTKRPIVKRLDRVSIVYPINKEKLKIAHPLGGGIYIEVPSDSTAGLVDIYAKNVVLAPFYSATSFRKTSLEQWNQQERKKLAPWVDFESDKFMMQVPASWINNLENPETLIQHYDNSMDAISQLTGRALVRSKVVLYQQVDVQMRGGAFFPGYPQSNVNWNPLDKEKDYTQHWFLQGPQHTGHILFHEMGHMERITKFKGEVEAIVNLLYVAVHNKLYGVDLDDAFSLSMGAGTRVSIEKAAISRMITENFRQSRPRNTTNRPGDEVKYQHRGYGHYADIVKLFGWEAIESFFAMDQENYRKGVDFPKDINKDDNDNRILRLSIAAQADLTPLLYFWGIHPEEPKELAREMKKHKLEPSALIYDRLRHYQSIILMDNQAFREFALIMYPRVLSTPRGSNESNPLYGQGWYANQLDKYQSEHGALAQEALDKIIATYFPSGRPTN